MVNVQITVDSSSKRNEPLECFKYNVLVFINKNIDDCLATGTLLIFLH